jgi:hypothetical protein
MFLGGFKRFSSRARFVEADPDMITVSIPASQRITYARLEGSLNGCSSEGGVGARGRGESGRCQVPRDTGLIQFETSEVMCVPLSGDFKQVRLQYVKREQESYRQDIGGTWWYRYKWKETKRNSKRAAYSELFPGSCRSEPFTISGNHRLRQFPFHFVRLPPPQRSAPRTI